MNFLSGKINFFNFKMIFNSTKEIRKRTEEHLAIFYEGLIKEYGEELKVRFLETFEFYKEIYNCEERMAEWKKVKYDLKRYSKLDTLYKKLK